MGDSSWWVGLLTAGTALGASWVTSRGSANSARVHAEVAAHAEHVAEARDRRREAYRELSAGVHALSEVFWRMEEVDQTSSAATKVMIIEEMQSASSRALSDVTKASRGVLLEGPRTVAEVARTLRRSALEAHWLLRGLSDGSGEHREPYNRAYREFREEHLRFLDAARAALEVT